jgi:hypothetical protein|tara:strand:- start:5262 stop:5927 length:666 start_codon:yes stop_codon:yes gene_type:complete
MSRDIGIPGTGPSSVTASDLSEEELAVVRYIKNADLDIQRRWFNWDYLWSETTITPSVGVSTLTSPADLGNWKLDSIVFSKATDDYQQLDFMDWEPYRLEYKLGVIDSGTPEVFSIKPDNVIDVWPTPDSTTTISTEYYRVPTELAADSDISSIPPRFHNMIIARAKIYYGENEDAPEILSGALASFEDLLDKLESDQLPGQKNRRFSKVQDLFNYTVRPE